MGGCVCSSEGRCWWWASIVRLPLATTGTTLASPPLPDAMLPTRGKAWACTGFWLCCTLMGRPGHVLGFDCAAHPWEGLGMHWVLTTLHTHGKVWTCTGYWLCCTPVGRPGHALGVDCAAHPWEGLGMHWVLTVLHTHGKAWACTGCWLCCPPVGKPGYWGANVTH